MSKETDDAKKYMFQALGTMEEISDELDTARQIIKGLLDFPNSNSWIERARNYIREDGKS